MLGAAIKAMFPKWINFESIKMLRADIKNIVNDSMDRYTTMIGTIF